VVVVVVFLMIVISWYGLASSNYQFLHLNATSEIVPGQHITGTSGQETSDSEYGSVYDAFVLNEDPFIGSPQWYENIDAEYRFVNNTEEGVFLELWGDVVHSGSTEYWRILNLPLEDYSNVTFSTGITVLSGQVSCTVRAVFTRSPDAYSSIYDFDDYPFDLFSDQNTTLITAGEEIALTLYIQLDDLIDYYPGWLVQSWFHIRLVANEPTTVVINSARVRVASKDLLCPLDIDIESPNGSSLFDNDFVKWAYTYPILNLTRGNGSEGYSVIRPSRRSDLVYARPGMYSGVAGWWKRGGNSGELGAWQSGFMLCPVQVNASADPDYRLSLRVRIPTVRLSLEASPLPPIVWFKVTQTHDNVSISPFSMSGVNTPLPAYVYIPGLNSSLAVFVYESSMSFGSTGLHLYAGFDMDGSEDLRLVSDIHYVSVLGVIANPVAVFRLAVGVALFAACVLLGCLYNGSFSMTRTMRKPLILSIGCLLLSMLVPWYSETIRFQSDIPPASLSDSFLWFYLVLQSNNSGPQFLAVQYVSGVEWFVLMFWIPLFVLGTRLTLDKKDSFDWLALLLLLVLLCFSSFGGGGWAYMFWYLSFSSLGPGFLLFGAAPVVYLLGEALLHTVSRIRTRGIPFARRQ